MSSSVSRTRSPGTTAVVLGGTAVAGQQTGALATSSLAIAELIAFPLLVLLSLVFFRGVAALLPVAIGGFSVLGAFAVLRAINSVAVALAVRAEPGDRSRSRAGDRLQLVLRLALPRGARPRRRRSR